MADKTEVKKKGPKIKTFGDPNGVIDDNIKNVMQYWSEKDGLAAPRTEAQMLELLLVNYAEYLDKKKPGNFDARNMLGDSK